ILETIPEPRRKEASALSSRIADGETITSFESQRITKCKQEIEVWLTLTALKNRDQKVYAIASTERDITERKRKESQKEIYFQETDLAKVKALTGLLPICASCKQIRDANGDWHQVESYIRDRSEATFSHSLCPQCVNKFYPDCRARAEGTPKARKTSVAAAQNLIRIPRT
ncbi:MAG TPA: hypothetical protein PLP17_14760, partial [Oligoflexia bacterium]|nr:hypothetical protein [Oligoflexia bacterium]